MSLERVARRARVSTATVSRVLNDTGPVKPSTRARVLKAIAALNYSPNPHARTLAGGQSRSIGVIVSNIDNPFFLDVYRAVETRAHDAGYEVIMANTDYRSERLVSQRPADARPPGRRPGRHRLRDGLGADCGTQRAADSRRVLRRRNAAAQHHEHPRRLRERHVEADGLPL